MSILKISKEQLIKRVKSLSWRAGMMVLVMIVGFVLDNLEVLNLSPATITVVGLILGEISKMLNKNLQELKAVALGKLGKQSK